MCDRPGLGPESRRSFRGRGLPGVRETEVKVQGGPEPSREYTGGGGTS